MTYSYLVKGVGHSKCVQSEMKRWASLVNARAAFHLQSIRAL